MPAHFTIGPQGLKIFVSFHFEIEMFKETSRCPPSLEKSSLLATVDCVPPVTNGKR